MTLTPLKEIIKLKPRPETTFSLETAIKDGLKTVETYRFTPSIRDYFCEILDLAASDRGQGYWIQAEYGAGKTHLLSTLGILLADRKGAAWNGVTDSEVRSFRTALVEKSRLFPVILNCKGRLATEGSEKSLQRVLERAIEDALKQAGLRGKVAVSTSDEILEWWKRASEGIRSDITGKVRSQFTGNPTPDELLDKKGPEAFSRAVIDAARALSIEIPFSRDIRTRFNHIYRELTREQDYRGMLVIIDEFKSWQDLHPVGSSGFAEDEHVLETLAFHLPVDDHARIIAIVASQSAPPGKLGGGAQGDRFRTFPLFAREGTEREYDEIVAFRVREILSDRMPEVDHYYNHYSKNFKFLSQVKKEYFREIFPFQPRCFEVIRNITKKELATARSAIHYVHEVLSDRDVLSRRGLIKVADLLNSENLVKDLQTAAYKEAYISFQSAQQDLSSLFDEESDRQLADDVLKTLFLWHCASPDSPRGLTAQELAEACLATDDIIKSEDLIHGIILQRLKELSQVEYTNKERGAFFRVSAVSGPTYTQILTRFQRKVGDDTEAGPEWRRLLTAQAQDTEGNQMLFAGQVLDKPDKATGRANKVRYDGEKVVVERWSKSWGGPVVDKTNYSQHFRMVYLLEPADVSAEDLTDDRIAVIIPAEWKQVAKDEMRRYCAVLQVEKEYAPQQGPDAEEIRQSNKIKKRELLTEIKLKQVEAYRKGRIITRAGLGLNPDQVFASAEKAEDVIASALLEHAYRQPPFDPAEFKRELSATEPGRIFSALFQASSVNADKGAVENFGLGIGLVSKNKPFEFDPAHSPFLDTLRNELEHAGGDLRLYSFYEKYTGAPYGVPVDLLSLYLLAFVRLSRPPCFVAVKPEAGFTLSNGRTPRDNRIGYNEVPSISWTKGKLHRSFERLAEESGPAWNDYVEYFREMDETLQATDSPDQVIAQQERLAKAQEDLAVRTEALYSRFTGLARNLGQNVASQVQIKEALDAVYGADPHHLQTFQQVIEENFDNDRQKYKETFESLRRLEKLDQNYLQAISEAARYLDELDSLPAGEMKDERDRVRAMFSLDDFCATPETAEDALEAFERFRSEYAAHYQSHYRDYRNQIEALQNELTDLHPVLEGLQNINSIGYLGSVLDAGLVARHQELLARTDASHLQSGIPDVEKRAVVSGVTLDSRPPDEAVKRFRSDLDEVLLRCHGVLSPPPILEVLSASDAPEIKELVEAISAGELNQIARLFTSDVAGKVKALLHEARMVVVEVSLSDFGPIHIGDGSDDLGKIAQGFEQFLRNRLEKARKSNPGKIVQLNLK